MRLSKSSASNLRQSIRILCLSYVAYGSLALYAASAMAAPIVGGEEVSTSDPVNETTVALIILMPNGMATCTASLIAKDLAVTAAHCLTDDQGKAVAAANLRIIFGTNINVKSMVKRVAPVVGAIFNPAFKKVGGTNLDRSDVGILRFSGGLPSGYAPALLLPRMMKISNGESILLAGYGINDVRNGGSGDGVLRKAVVQVASVDVARTEILLDQRQGKGSCHGDSGGPAFVVQGSKNYLFGITSRGNEDCSMAIYSEITAHMSFFNQATKALRSIRR
ncbi:MAG: trypsin-like serine protease [Methylotenera sp.]|nr:trypsin-like serine protease [Oligoflexia bacterium]